jgi:hypothetical protein
MDETGETGEPGHEQRATFIVRLAKVPTAAWYGVVELVGRDRRRHVASVTELGEFIDGAFAERTETRGDQT